MDGQWPQKGRKWKKNDRFHSNKLRSLHVYLPFPFSGNPVSSQYLDTLLSYWLGLSLVPLSCLIPSCAAVASSTGPLRYQWHGSGSYENVTDPKHRPELVNGMPYNRTRAWRVKAICDDNCSLMTIRKVWLLRLNMPQRHNLVWKSLIPPHPRENHINQKGVKKFAFRQLTVL